MFSLAHQKIYRYYFFHQVNASALVIYRTIAATVQGIAA